MPHRSIRRMALVGGATFALVAVASIVLLSAMFVRMRDDLERDTRELLVEQRIADRLVTAVYGQIFAAYRYLQQPDSLTRAEFHTRGSDAYSNLRQYLFHDLPGDARLQVETVKERHQALEVVAQQAFDLAQQGDAEGARRRAAALQGHVTRLETAVDSFLVLREGQRNALRAEQATVLRRLLMSVALAVLVLAAGAVWLARMLQRRLLQPLEHFSAAAARLGSGELGARIPRQRDREFDSAAASFNRMADRIQTASEEIRSRNQELTITLAHLRRTREELVQHEKLSAMGSMLAGLAHELNNPLAGILGTAECLKMELEQFPDGASRALVPELVDPLVKESLRARDLVRHLLQFSRKSAAVLEPVPVARAVDVVVGLRAHAFLQARRQLVADVEPGLYVSAEDLRLQHALLNVVNNALDAMEQWSGSQVVIRARAEDGGWVAITVQDDGPGFTEPDRVFDAFYTTKEVGTGTGLGLTLVHRFIAECGGTVTASNAPGGGARVVIRLRAAAAPAPADSPEAAPPAEADDPPVSGDRPPRVLVVDDEESLRELQRRILVRLQFEVLVAADGAEARDVLRETTVDAVIADIRMPGELDGIGLFEWVRSNRPELTDRFLFVTGGVDEDSLAPLIERHPGRILTKPFQRDEYLRRVHELLAVVPAPNG